MREKRESERKNNCFKWDECEREWKMTALKRSSNDLRQRHNISFGFPVPACECWVFVCARQLHSNSFTHCIDYFVLYHLVAHINYIFLCSWVCVCVCARKNAMNCMRNYFNQVHRNYDHTPSAGNENTYSTNLLLWNCAYIEPTSYYDVGMCTWCVCCGDFLIVGCLGARQKLAQ